MTYYPVSLVGAGVGAADLLTVRALDRLRAAEVIFYDHLVDASVLAYAHAAAECICVGKRPGGASFTQDAINQLLVAAAQAGKKVVRLKAGDPLIFGRAAEEIAALEEAGIPYEIVPGVTSAMVAAAENGILLTERGALQTLVLTTGAAAAGNMLPDWAGYAKPGTTMAFYMSIGASAEIEAQLLAAGVPADATVDIIERAGHRSSRHVTGTLRELTRLVKAHALRNPAVVFLRLPAHHSAASLPALPIHVRLQ